MFGLPKIPWGMLGIADGTGTRPDNSQDDMDALTAAYAAARAHNRTPAGRVARGWDQFAPQSALAEPMLPTPPTPSPVDMGVPPPALSAQAMAPSATPMPAPRPVEAPAQPQDPMGFFARNAALMQDPSSGAFIDPVNAARAQASGPDLINKLLGYFHQKDNA